MPGAEAGRSLPEAETLGGAVRRLSAAFRSAGLDTPGLDARRLVEAATGGDSVALVREPERLLSAAEQQRLAAMADRRLGREPVSRIFGSRVFHGLELEISRATLDPRPDTEVIVDGVLQLVAEHAIEPSGLRILDLGTGSGALLVALLAALPGASGVGIDISAGALDVAQRNARRHGLAGRVLFQRGNWFEGVDERFGLVVSNPPYIPSGVIAGLDPEVRLFDPLPALDGGADGLDCYRQIAAGLGEVLEPCGWVAVEVGQGQAASVSGMLAGAIGGGSERRVWLDLSGIGRGVACRAQA
ncbi:MAG: peptide chain release factor N(5)-glutamine methyltransferase [Proteobacteria bacterium]|nr:peptide chain release factor N(5)-glutamine methyltransferase [Pseudomonadota bacterium]